MEKENKIFGISSFWLKVIACILMTFDHIALLFIERGTSDTIPTLYYIFRAVGKISFPIFAFLAVEGAYKSKNPILYLIRLGSLAILLDIFGYSYGAIMHMQIASNPLIGNAFTDIFMGVLLIYLLRKKNVYSLFALIPLGYEIFSDFPISEEYGTLFKSDWGTFSIVLFLTYFIAREIADYYVKRKSSEMGIQEEAFNLEKEKYHKYFQAIALIFTEALFYLIYRIDYTAFVIPNEFIPIGTYSTLAVIFILLYNGKKGYSKSWIQYSFYSYYPLHLMILGIFSMYFGVLSNL